MPQNKQAKKKIEKELFEIQKAGIQADVEHIKKDMCAQFTNPEEWIREYVVNSYDAMAGKCEIWSEYTDGAITIYVSDDGHGMKKQGIIDFCTLYRSRKQRMAGKTVGQFGIGKLSVAAIPGQKKFKVKTSTGKECWIAEAGNLLTDEPIQIYSISDVSAAGTLFEITFETNETQEEVMMKLSKILRKYTAYLPIKTIIHYPSNTKTRKPKITERIDRDWSAASENYERSYNINLYGDKFEVIMGIGLASNELYQNKVLVSDSYNLLSYDISNKIQLPHLRIRINSAAFQLPFGRHCLRNEDILAPLAKHIRNHILPRYFDFLLKVYNDRYENSIRLENDLKEIATALVVNIPDLNKKWCKIPLFSIYPQKLVSLSSLEKMVTKAGKVYLEENENTGMDYSFFDAPILLQDQPKGGVTFLQEYFKKELINLSLNDVVIEIPSGSGFKLSKEEKDFMENLGLADDIFNLNKKKSPIESFDGFGGFEGSEGFGFFNDKENRLKYDSPEINESARAFRNLKWRANYLVGRDGKTPCMTHRFLINHNTVIMNLFHPDVKELVKLSATAPMLIGHWAVAMCLTEDNRILSFLSAESREDLLLMDAMLKVNSTNESKTKNRVNEFKKMRKSISNLFRDSELNFGLN
jgi:hypothetical protein